ncbi:xanthine dehydrogenase small subunit [Marinomonas sp. A79]|uniref:Xanthine dehydrogenase small subunit n=1 Tax=Marinomonas vulgaris TaxID=2823372 RepID=A0ABS5H8N2_9GAMM|nr:xanthine dehydrogenase small subunit [Marinomonas vulgaris]MBR7887797.1 xanthine dehydrogenase small subunit [Marinomonas vulgaris]
MKLLLNDELIEDNTLASDYTALRYLREKRGLMGTKEGCASGDCGACTLLVGALEEGELRYTTLNSCITPIQSLAGKHLVSVEYLSQQNALHPAQQAVVECHGSQCGFCTPGFVLSLASLYEERQSTQQSIDRESVCDAISGNLCRCTGYRPIIDAGLSMTQVEPDYVALLSQNHKVKQTLSELESSASLADDGSKSRNYVQPQNLAQLIAAKKACPDGVLIAGGTDLMLENTQRYHDFDDLIDLSQVTEMTTIQDDGQYLTLGASVTYADLETYCQDKYPHISGLLSRIASRQIRNRGTLGGNVANASPIADIPPLLLAFDADMQLLNVDGTTRTVSINDFYQGYKQTLLATDEWIVSFSVSLEKLAQCHRFYKVSKRMEDDISSVMLAARFAIEDDKITEVRLAFGGMAGTPIRAVNAEQALTQVSVNDEQALQRAIEKIRAELHPMSDVRASSRYRLDMACNLIRKAWLALNNQEAVTFSGHAVSDTLLITGNEETNHA